MRTASGGIKYSGALAFGMLVCMLPILSAQDALVSSISGSVYVDGHLLEQAVEVSLEGADGATVARSFNSPSDIFTFSNVLLRLENSYYFVLRVPGFKKLRQRLDIFDLSSRGEGAYAFNRFVILQLERSVQDDDVERRTGPKTIPLRLLGRCASEEALREYKKGLECSAAANHDSAIAHFEKALDLEPGYYDAINRLGTEYLRAGRYFSAESMFNQANAINPEDPIPLTNLGILYFQEGEMSLSGTPEEAESFYGSAVEALERALRLDFRNPRTNYYLGAVLYRIGSYPRAEEFLTAALSLDARMCDAYVALSNLYCRQERYADALKQIEDCLKINPHPQNRKNIEEFRRRLLSLTGSQRQGPSQNKIESELAIQ